MLNSEELKVRIEQRIGSYRELLRLIVDSYQKRDEDHEYALKAKIYEEFDSEWEARVHRNMVEQLRAEMIGEIETLKTYIGDVESRVSKAGYDARNELPRPDSNPSAQ